MADSGTPPSAAVLGPGGPTGPGLNIGPDYSPENLVEMVHIAEELGYVELWYGDIPFVRDCYMALAVAAVNSKRILLGPGVSVPQSRRPVLIASAIASLDELSGGRALVGLGSGAGVFLPQMYRSDRSIRGLREAIELTRLLLGGGEVQYEGEVYSQNGGRLAFRLDHQIPIFVACHGPQALRLSGRLADGILLANMARSSGIQKSVAFLREGEAAANRPSGSVRVHLRLESVISEDREAAIAEARKRVAGRMVNSWPRWDWLDALGVRPAEATRQAAQAKDVKGVAAGLSDDDIRSNTLAGTPDDVIAQLRRTLNSDVNQLTIKPLGQNMETWTQTVNLFARRVWPEIRASLGSRAGGTSPA